MPAVLELAEPINYVDCKFISMKNIERNAVSTMKAAKKQTFVKLDEYY
jgi:hypothetical protein